LQGRFGEHASSLAGDGVVLHNSTTNETLFHKFYQDPSIGKKFVLSNALQVNPDETGSPYFFPGCDHFSLVFNTCDHYNHHLNDRTFPHYSSTTLHAIHDFLFSCVLNVETAYLNAHQIDPATSSFRDLMVRLADSVYEYSLEI